MTQSFSIEHLLFGIFKKTLSNLSSDYFIGMTLTKLKEEKWRKKTQNWGFVKTTKTEFENNAQQSENIFFKNARRKAAVKIKSLQTSEQWGIAKKKKMK